MTAVTGVIERDLNVFMTQHGVTTLSQPLNDVETVGGMVSAATHVSLESGVEKGVALSGISVRGWGGSGGKGVGMWQNMACD